MKASADIGSIIGQYGFGEYLSTSRALSVFIDNTRSQTILQMLSDRRQLVRPISF